ncbi:MAG: cation-transporting P-type ATPase, partial [Deltaproteobacteria bacterium]|nr:cation-transporting P-type ATPase [Deltaproteobacteria bacterium]
FFNLFAVLLWAGALMAFIAGMAELSFAIALVVAINALFSFWQEYKAERAVWFLQRLLPRKVNVVRGGVLKEVDASCLVPGDLVRFSAGDTVSSDGRLIEAEELRVDNSPITGESKPIYKVAEPVSNGKNFVWTDIPNLVFAGTYILSGRGTMVVTATGMDTEIGKVAYMTEAIKSEASPLQKELVKVTRTVTVIAITLGVSFFLLGYAVVGLTFLESFIFAIGIIVANVPEGVLPTVSLSLAMGVQRMAARKAIVKKLSAVETLGCATVICSDKTGTLTTNSMCAVRLFVNMKYIDITGSGYEPEGRFILRGRTLKTPEMQKEGVLKLAEAVLLCNNAMLISPAKEAPYWSVAGDPTEGALLTLAKKAGVDPVAANTEYPRIAHLPFEAIRKRMSTVHGFDGGKVVFIKGAPREILTLCETMLHNGKTEGITALQRHKILDENDRMANEGLRVLAVAMRELDEKVYTVEVVEKGLTFLGLVSMHDPPRPEVKKAIAECRGAGIRVIMITGDYGLTARSVAKEIGLSSDITRIVTGQELLSMPHRALMELVKRDAIFARTAPADKLRIVTALQDNGEVVAVTGDGVNDAPALKKADIGIAMGLRGSDVAKDSAEIVLADDNFVTIVEAIREGRAVYANIKKFITYIFASNIPEIVPFIAFVLFKIPLPLTIMQILAVDLGTDVLPALALGVEPPEKGIMHKPPRPVNSRLLDFKTLARAYLFLGPVEAALCLAGFFFSYWLYGWRPGEVMVGSGAIYAIATTMSLAGIVASQAGNVFACRTESESVFSAGLFKNRFVIFALIAEAIILLVLIYTPPLARLFGLAPLTINHWLFLGFFPISVLMAEEARKFIVRRFT